MSGFLYLKSIVQYRVPILPDGRLGSPEITAKFTTEDYAPKKKKPVKKQKEESFINEITEVTI